MCSLLFAVAAGGCAEAPQGVQPVDSVSATTVHPAVVSDARVPALSSGSPVPVAPGKVEVRLDRTSYRVGDVVRVTVANGLDTGIYTEDFKTACSIVVLQQSQGDEAWKDAEGCRLGRLTVTVTTGPGLGYVINIDPKSFHFEDNGGFDVGTYRIRFGYRLERDKSGEEPLVVYSPEFKVQ